ncbi:gliding motility lipoprotein GldD [Bacteroidota bacterium]
MDDPPELLNILLALFWTGEFSFSLVVGIVVLLGLLVCSGLISGAEVAFFSLSKQEVEEMASSTNRYRNQVSVLLDRPKRLLATILVANNFVNVGIVILSTFLISKSVPASDLNYMLGGLVPVGLIIEVFGITLIVLLFGEIMPKIYASLYSVAFSSAMAFPLKYMSVIFGFISVPLIKLTSLVDSRAPGSANRLSVDELSYALDLTKSESPKEKEDRKILEGIVKFGNTDVKQIMKPRTDIEAVDCNTPYTRLVDGILDSGYSRVPIYEDSLDKILGIIYVKDLLAHMDKNDDFDWRALIREPFFVPESKMIDDLLEEFRERKVHLAIVVDEYGGCEGLVTLEDIIEEIVGDISDEFDDDEVIYSKLDANNFVFEGKTNLKQFYRAIKIEGEEFEKHKGESDTLAGFILELAGKIPVKDQQFEFSNFTFTIESVDKRRIKRVKVSRQTEEPNDDSKISGLLSLVLLLLSLGLASCNSDYTPKPRGYIRIDVPEKAYEPVTLDCPFSFESAVYSKVVMNQRGGGELCWFNIEYPQYKAKFHFSYKPLHNDVQDFLEESRSLTNKHMLKAAAIDETLIVIKERKVYGTIYSVEGAEVASPLQLHLTDSINHFLRGALYFHVSPNNDSLAPVIELIRDDMLRLVETFNWKQES